MPLDLPGLRIPLQPISVDAFRPYGQVVGPGPDGLAHADLVQHWRTRAADLLGQPALDVNHVARLPRKALQFDFIEIHPLSDQLSVTFDGPFAFAVYREGVDPEGPVAERDIAAFEVPANYGILIRANLWHCGTLPFERDTEALFVFREGTLKDNTEVRHIELSVISRQ